MVVDASVALSWVLSAENSDQALSLRSYALENPQALLLIPPNFWYEVANVLWVAVRRKRMSRQDAFQALELLIDFKFTVWITDPENCLNLSFIHDLTVYDAAYLDIAIDEQVTLWTMDQSLKKAAEASDIIVQP